MIIPKKNMRYNEHELISSLAFQTPEWEGRLMYKPPKSGGGFGRTSSNADFKERWFRLRANCLFYWRLRPPPGSEPLGVLVLEHSHVQQEGFAESVHAFSIIFGEDPEKKHVFLADSQRHVQQWISVIRKGRYDVLRERLIGLQIKLVNRTGRDPLVGTGFEHNPIYCNKATLNVVVPDFSEGVDGVSPKPKPRKAKVRSTFQSHVVESWENISIGRKDVVVEEKVMDYSSDRKASFLSHVKVPEGTLIDLS